MTGPIGFQVRWRGSVLRHARTRIASSYSTPLGRKTAGRALFTGHGPLDRGAVPVDGNLVGLGRCETPLDRLLRIPTSRGGAPALDHRLGNLLLLNRNKNSQAQNFDFATKKEKYFNPAAGVTGFALTTLVLSESAWTPDIVEQRQKDLVELLAEERSL